MQVSWPGYRCPVPVVKGLDSHIIPEWLVDDNHLLLNKNNHRASLPVASEAACSLSGGEKGRGHYSCSLCANVAWSQLPPRPCVCVCVCVCACVCVHVCARVCICVVVQCARVLVRVLKCV